MGFYLLISIFLALGLVLVLALVEFFRNQNDVHHEIKWLRRTVALLGVAVMLLSVRATLENSLFLDLKHRVEISENAILELQAMPQYQKTP